MSIPKLPAYFYFQTDEIPARRLESGQPVYEEIIYISITIPGLSGAVVTRAARESDKAEYPVEYAKFKQGADQDGQISGTPLAMWAPMPKSTCLELKFFGIRSVEDLANAADGAIANYRGGREWQRTAKAWLESANDSKHVVRMDAELASRDRQISRLEQTVADMGVDNDRVKKLEHDVDQRERRISMLEQNIMEMEIRLSAKNFPDDHGGEDVDPAFVPVKRGPGRPAKAA